MESDRRANECRHGDVAAGREKSDGAAVIVARRCRRWGLVVTVPAVGMAKVIMVVRVADFRPELRAELGMHAGRYRRQPEQHHAYRQKDGESGF